MQIDSITGVAIMYALILGFMAFVLRDLLFGKKHKS